ncbi:MAG: flavodoxin domain-containing protein [Gemmatimonadota bacterium]
MKPILVVYGTTEGQTRKIAEFIAERLRQAGKAVDLVDSTSPAAAQVAPIYAGAFVGGSLHQGRHQAPLAHFVKGNAAWLNTIPSAFFSVSLSMASQDEEWRAEAKQLADQFLSDTGLKAGMVRLVAGALKYTEYDFFRRWMMKAIAKKAGGSTDTSHDTEYTDWNDVARFVDEFLAATRGEERKAA